MNRYVICYRDLDPACPVFRMAVQAYDLEHARERFHEGPDGEGWLILSIRRKELA